MKAPLIVHPVSNTESGKTALATAVALARLSGADLHLLEVAGRRRSSKDSSLRPITDESVNISAVRLVGDVVDAVVDYAKSRSADLVVVADRARAHGPYWRRGMYAKDLARHLSVPLVSVPASRDERPARADGSSEESRLHAEAIAPLIEWDTLATTAGSEALINGPTIAEGTLKEAVEVAAGVITVTRPGAHQRVSMSSSLARVLRSAPGPVLVLSARPAGRMAPPGTSGRDIHRRGHATASSHVIHTAFRTSVATIPSVCAAENPRAPADHPCITYEPRPRFKRLSTWWSYP
jgi:nucleotide-binding universal stress UspA family protein